MRHARPVHFAEPDAVTDAKPLTEPKSEPDRIAEPDALADTKRHANALADCQPVAVVHRNRCKPVAVVHRNRCKPVADSVCCGSHWPGCVAGWLSVRVANGISEPVADRQPHGNTKPNSNSQPVTQPFAITVTQPFADPDAYRLSVAFIDRLAVASALRDPRAGNPDAGRQLAARLRRPAIPGNSEPGDSTAAARARMVTIQVRARGVRDPETLRALSVVPREQFVPRSARNRAYEDRALGIGGGQTISQPFIVGRSTEALGLDAWRAAHPGERPRVLDVGTGSGYQAAVLAEMGATVTSIEVNQQLALAARQRLAELGYVVEVIHGDGSQGYSPNAPYAAIVVAAAAPSVPVPLVAQLADGGSLVIPIGDRGRQMLTVLRRVGDRVAEEALEPVVFVPLLGRHGFH